MLEGQKPDILQPVGRMGKGDSLHFPAPDDSMLRR